MEGTSSSRKEPREALHRRGEQGNRGERKRSARINKGDRPEASRGKTRASKQKKTGRKKREREADKRADNR